MRFSLPRTPLLLLYGLAAAFLVYWHWRHILDALPFLVVLACPLMHLFMHHGHGHRHDAPPENHRETKID
ncbi:DUF2933 domain-containing protein [Methylocystis echinoides]|uniref:DUF2933 domain-containing protein n=1 Tax=Methylocystis echinoides TaxID=29468 RepID=UPI0024931478|nr:DUF2933 domain-containing protein [Methylocystis echinoides]